MTAATTKAPKTSSRSISGKRPDIEAELRDKYHVDFAFMRRVSTDEFDIDESLKNQARFEPIDEETVQLYQEAVERGDNFPAVLAHRRGRKADAKLVIIDGNHRLVAHQRAGKPIDVYEIDRSTKPNVIALMTFVFNTRHGRPTSEEERISQALFLIDNGATQESAAAAVNVPLRLLKRALVKAKADQRADEVGVDRREWDALTSSVKSRLVTISTDEGFHGAVHLAATARLGAEEVFPLVETLNSSRSARKQRDIINAEASRFQERMQDSAGATLNSQSNRGRMTPKARLGTILGQVFSLPDDYAGLSKAYGAAEREEAASRVMDASERLRKLAMSINPDLR